MTTWPSGKPSGGSVYKVDLGRNARKDLDKLQGPIFERVVATLRGLAQNPRPFGYEPVEGSAGGFRVREGDYRILYQIDDEAQVVAVLRIRHRREAYRRF